MAACQSSPQRKPGGGGDRMAHATAARRAQILVITGPSRVGKTTVCRGVIDAARQRGLLVAGVLTEDGADEAGAALQLARDLSSNDCHLLARARVGVGGLPGADRGLHEHQRCDALRPNEALGLRWEFDPEGLAFGRQVLRAAKAACDLLVVDQIGPLEIRHGGGWTVVFELLCAAHYDLALVVVNPTVVDEFVATLKRSCQILQVDQAVRAALPAAIAADYLT